MLLHPILVMHFLSDDGTKLNFLQGIAGKLKSGALLVLVDLEGEIGSDEYNTLNAAWKNQQIFIRGERDRVIKNLKCVKKRFTSFLKSVSNLY